MNRAPLGAISFPASLMSRGRHLLLVDFLRGGFRFALFRFPSCVEGLLAWLPSSDAKSPSTIDAMYVYFFQAPVVLSLVPPRSAAVRSRHACSPVLHLIRFLSTTSARFPKTTFLTYRLSSVGTRWPTKRRGILWIHYFTLSYLVLLMRASLRSPAAVVRVIFLTKATHRAKKRR